MDRAEVYHDLLLRAAVYKQELERFRESRLFGAWAREGIQLMNEIIALVRDQIAICRKVYWMTLRQRTQIKDLEGFKEGL